MHRRLYLRMLSFFCGCLLLAGGAVLSSRAAEAAVLRSETEAERDILLSLTDEAQETADLLSSAAGEEALRPHLYTIGVLASLLPPSSLFFDSVSSAACFYRTLESPAPGSSGASLRDTAEACAEAFAVLSGTLLSREGREDTALLRAAERLRYVTGEFLPDPLRTGTPALPPSLFSGEPPEHRPADRLSSLLGASAALLGPPRKTEGLCPVYLFSAADGFAELSVHGGHLLRFALCPHPPAEDPPVPARAAAVPEEAADAFVLSCIGQLPPVRSCRDSRGLRFFSYAAEENGALLVTVGVRISDGRVFFFDGTAFYQDSAAP